MLSGPHYRALEGVVTPSSCGGCGGRTNTHKPWILPDDKEEESLKFLKIKMFRNDTISATARDGYEKFDCAHAVALIAFIGLLSNFQDIIDEFTNIRKKRRRRRSDIGEVPYLHLPQYFQLADLMSGAQWEDMVHPTPKTLQWAAEGMQVSMDEDITWEDVTNESNEMGDTVEDIAIKRSGTKYKNLDEDSDEIYITQNLTDDSNYGLAEDSNLSSDVGRKSSLLTDLAHIGLQLAMWLVDTSDGRVSSEAGHAGVCRATQTLAKSHGWVGSIAANLLRRTLADALAKHEPTRILLQNAGMAGKALLCQKSFET